MRALKSAVLAALLLTTYARADAEVEVSPKPKDAAVQLDTGTDSPSTTSPAPAPGTGPPTGNTPVTDSPVVAPDPLGSFCQPDQAGVIQCHPRAAQDEEPPGDEERPEVTDGDVLRAVRTIGLPSLSVHVQPGGKTLVNVPTIFYAQPQPFARSVELLGYQVDLAASPVQYLWVHGDGSARTTTTPGKPYPAMDVTHQYREPAADVRARVDVTYRVRFRVDGGPWQTLGQTLLASGPATQLQVSEAAPVLTKP